MNRRTLLALAGIFAVALGLRLAVLYQRSASPGFDVPIVDAGAYDQTARQLLAGDGAQPRMFWQPIFYPLYLSAVYGASGGSVLAAKIVQALLGAVTCCLTFLLATRLRLGTGTALLAAMIPALYGPLILFEGELLAAAWAAFWSVALVLLFTFAGSRFNPAIALGLGAAGAVAVLTRPTFLPFYGAAWLWLLWRWRHDLDRRRLTAALATGVLGFGALTLPVAFASHSVTGDFGFLPGSGGLNSYIGNNPEACETLSVRPGDAWGELIDLPAQAGATGYAERNRYFYDRVLDYARQEPLAFAAGLGAKALRFSSSRELPRNIDVYVAGGESNLLAALAWKLGRFGFPFGVVLPLALLGLIHGRRRLGTPLCLYLGLYALAVVAVFVTARYRVPVIPVLAIPAAIGAFELVAAIRARGRRLAVAAVTILAGVLLATLPGRFCEEALDMETDFFYCLAYAQAERGKVEDAIVSYGRALESNPQLAEVHLNLGKLHADRDELELATEHYSQAIAIDPGFARAHNNLGSVARRQGKIEEAIRHFTAAADAEPRGTQDMRRDTAVLARRNLARSLLAAGRSQEALARIDALEELTPGDAEIPLLRGGAYLQTGDLERAVEELRRAADADPDNAQVRNDLGTALLGRRDLAGAREQFEKAIELDPDHLQAYNNAGAVLAMLGDNAAARVKLEEAVRRAPDYADAHYNLATILLRLGDVGRAVEELRETLRLQPNHPRAGPRLRQIMEAAQTSSTTTPRR